MTVIIIITMIIIITGEFIQAGGLLSLNWPLSARLGITLIMTGLV